MPAIKDLSRIAAKYGEVTPLRAPQYKEGVENPRRSWSIAAANAEDAWEGGVQQAIQRNAFSKGVKEAGDEKWLRGAVEKGVDRFGPGVQLGVPDYQAGFAPFHSVIQATNLPPRFPKGDPRNIQRVAVMAKALRDKKESLA